MGWRWEWGGGSGGGVGWGARSLEMGLTEL